MTKALMIGSTVADVLVHVDHMPSVEEDINAIGQSVTLGGCCYNVSHMLSVFDVPYTLFTPVGTGIYGTFIMEQLHKAGIEPAIRCEERNGCCYCVIDKNGHRTFMSVRGAEYRFRREWFEALDADSYTDAYVCGLELEEESGACIIEFLQAHPNLHIYFAPSSRLLGIPRERMNDILDCHPFLHLNKSEANMMLAETGMLEQPMNDVSALCRMLYERTNNTVVITEGSKGAYAFDGERDYFEPAIKVKAVDGTGAGDGHLGTIIAMRMKGAELSAALRTANFISSRIVQQNGGVLKLDE